MERFGIALKRARIARNMDQEQLADLSGINRTYISKIETGRIYRPEPETIDRLAAALDMTADDLLANVEPPLMLREDRGLYAVDFWADDWAGDPSDNVFASAAEAWDELPRILASFGDRPADESDEYAPAFTPEYRVVEIV